MKYVIKYLLQNTCVDMIAKNNAHVYLTKKSIQKKQNENCIWFVGILFGIILLTLFKVYIISFCFYIFITITYGYQNEYYNNIIKFLDECYYGDYSI